MVKIQIKPIAAESFGVRSMCVYVKTGDISLVIDPGCSLGPRLRLDPHPKEYSALFQANQRLVGACQEADLLTISHYHYDHLKPSFNDYHFILSNVELAERLYTDKIILAKDFREHINASQRQRGYFFNRFAKNYAKEIIWADGQRFEYGNTIIQISPPLPHGEKDSKQGFVVSCAVRYDDEVFVHAEVQGPILQTTLNYILAQNPTLVYVGGPPLYLSGYRVSETTLTQAKMNMIELAKAVPSSIVDHHLLRDPHWSEFLKPVTDAAELSNHWVGTAAEFYKSPVEILEALRKNLYNKHPPTEEFLQWTKQSDEYKKNELPPTLTSPF
jgi:predicted metallo-beta-lactamase superfamily hydrolase